MEQKCFIIETFKYGYFLVKKWKLCSDMPLGTPPK